MSQSFHAERPVGRLAPSPTGLLHLGHARTFLLAWWDLRARAGRVLLRLEDLDGSRASPGWFDAVLRDLEWLGLDWDETPLVQSSGQERFEAALERLQQQGLVYPCVCTRGEIRSMQSAPQQGDTETRYPGTCRGRFRSLADAERISGRTAALRFSVSPGVVCFHDRQAGSCAIDVEEQVGDFLVARKDRSPAYQLAVVVDDAFQGVTDVHRGADLLDSTARQWHLQEALGLPHPEWTHFPLVCDAAGRRLAKRADDLSLQELRVGGTDPRAIVGWAARSAGQETPERAHPAALLGSFSLARVPPAPVTLAPEDVRALREARA